MGKVKVMISNNQTEVKVPVGIRMLIRRCCHAVLEYENFKEDAEVSVTFVNVSAMKSKLIPSDSQTDSMVALLYCLITCSIPFFKFSSYMLIDLAKFAGE